MLLAAGIGVTPIIGMLNYLVQINSTRQVFMFMGARDGAHHPFKKQLSAIAAANPNVHLITCYSHPLSSDNPNSDFDITGRVTIDVLKSSLPSSNFEFYLCGPPTFIDALTSGLEEWGVPKESVKLEAFGAASVKCAKDKHRERAKGDPGKIMVQFARSGKSVAWDGKYETLLELAEAQGVSVDSGCRAGSCGTCLTAVKSGKVEHQSEPGSEVEEGTCLPCIGVPDENVILDA